MKGKIELAGVGGGTSPARSSDQDRSDDSLSGCVQGPVNDTPVSVSVTRLMREIEDDVRRRRRTRLVARGGPSEYRDGEVFAAVESVLPRAVESHELRRCSFPSSSATTRSGSCRRTSASRAIVRWSVPRSSRSSARSPAAHALALRVQPRELPAPGTSESHPVRLHRGARDRERASCARRQGCAEGASERARG